MEMFSAFWPWMQSFDIAVIMDMNNPDSKVHEANMGPIWGCQDLGGPHVGPMNLSVWEAAM